jgi:hypothetical protein
MTSITLERLALLAFVAGFAWNVGAWVCAVVTGALTRAVGYGRRDKP